MKILALDIGEKRIGLAIGDGKFVTTMVIKNQGVNQTIHEIGQICRKNSIEKIIIGMPKSRQSLQVDKIHKFALELAKNIQLPIDYVDETLTSKEAERILEVSKLNSRSKRFKEEVDKISAKLILEQYLNESTKLQK